MPPRRETESLAPKEPGLESSVEAYCMVERVLSDFSLQSRPLLSPIASLQPQFYLRQLVEMAVTTCSVFLPRSWLTEYSRR